MKQNEVGDFTILYVESGDQRTDLFQTVATQKKPVVLMLADHVGILQKPDDFTLLKYVKRQVDVPIIFILPQGGQQAQLAARNGFPVYQSIDALSDALSIGQIARTRMTHPANASHSPATPSTQSAPRTTNPLSPRKDDQETASTGLTGTPGPRRSGSLRDTQQRQQHEPTNIPSTSPLSHSPTALNPFDTTTTFPTGPVNNHDPQIQQRLRQFPPQFTPIPQAFIAEQDMEQQNIYLDPEETLHPDTKDMGQYNSGNSWSGINVTDRNTTPLGKTSSSPVPPIPQARYRPRASRNLSAHASENAVANAPTIPPLSTDIPALDEEEIQTRPRPKQKSESSALPPLSHVQIPHNQSKRPSGKRRILSLFIVLLCALAVIAGGSFLVLPRFLNTAAPAPQVAGHLVFTSSGQVSETSSQGIEDQVTLDLTHVASPTSGKALYAWLLGDKSQSDLQTILLGKLQVNNGVAHLFYSGDTQHTNILLTMSRILVTEEDATVTPIAPSPDQNTWQYYSEFSSTPISAPDNVKHFSFLDHLRHLLASDPTLQEFELPGGLNNWLYNNTNKVLEWVDSTRQQWEETKDTGFVRRQLERSLQFLDGDTFVYQDLPQGTSLLVNERLARIGLINITGPNQTPPDYLDHITTHLNGLLEAKPSSAIRQRITALITAMGNINQWLKQVRHDAQQLMNMTDAQMTQESTLSVIDDMITNMDNAYSGQVDPSTNTMREGVNWIHDQMQFLASMDITAYSTSTNNILTPNNPDLSQPRVLISEDKGAKR